MKPHYLLAAALLLPGCASIIEGSSQNLNLATVPNVPSQCTLTNERGSWQVNAPGRVTLDRSVSDLNVECVANGFSGDTIEESGLEPWAAGNLLFGGVIGGVVDAATGSLFAYDKNLSVPVSPVRYSGNLSAVQNPIVPNSYVPEQTGLKPTPRAIVPQPFRPAPRSLVGGMQQGKDIIEIEPSYAPQPVQTYRSAAHQGYPVMPNPYAPQPPVYQGVPVTPGVLPLPPRQ